MYRSAEPPLLFSAASLLVRCPFRGPSGPVAVAPSSMQLVPPAAPSVRPRGADLTPNGCGAAPAGRTAAGRAHAAPSPTLLTA